MDYPASRSGSAPLPAPQNCHANTNTRNATGKRRKSFRISSSGSPQYHARPESPAMPTPPMMGSRIPCKSPGYKPSVPTQARVSTTSHHAARPRYGQGIKSDISRLPTGPPERRRGSPSNQDKPLPSPPVMQTANPASPPKAQRTLVDAEVAGTPSSEDWPAITPEIITTNGAGSAGSRNIDNDNSVVPDSFLATASHHEDPKLTAAASDDLTTTNANTPPSAVEETPHMLTDAHSDLTTTKYPSTTVDDEAMDNPLARTIVFPPRVSSKQASPLSCVGSDEAGMVSSAATAIVHHREISDNAQWPLLDTIPCEKKNDDLYSDKGDDGGGASESTDAYHTAASERASTESIPAKTNAFVNHEEPKDKEEGFRTKRLASHSSMIVEGMTLKISDDADALLLRNNPLPLPNTTRNAMSAIALRTASRLSAGISRTPTPHANGREVSHGTTSEELGSNQLRVGDRMRQYSADAPSTPLPKNQIIMRKRAVQVDPMLNASVATGYLHSPAIPSNSTTAVRSKTTPTLSPSSPHFHRGGSSPSYAQVRGAPLMTGRMMDQRATLRKAANDPKQSTKPVSSRLKGEFIKGGNASHKADEESVPDKKIKPQRSLKNLIFHKKTSEGKEPPVPTAPKRSFKNSTFMGTTLGGRFAKMSQKGVEERERHLAKSGEWVSSQATHDKSGLVDTQMASTNPRTQWDNARMGMHLRPAQNGKSEIVSDTMTMVNNLIGSPPKLSSTALDHLRGLEIAEVIHDTIAACKKAHIAAVEAQTYAREAALSVEKANLALSRMEKLCEQDLGDETVRTVKEWVKGMKTIRQPSTVNDPTPSV